MRSLVAPARARGWDLVCQSSPEPGKAAALNRADELVAGPIRIYLDADVVCAPDMIGKAAHGPRRRGTGLCHGPTGRRAGPILGDARLWSTRG